MLNTGKSDIRFFIFCAKNSPGMPWSTPNRIVQNAAQLIFLPPTSAGNNKSEYYWKNRRPVIGRYDFRSWRQPEAVNFFLPCQPLATVMGASQHDTLWIRLKCGRHSWGRKFVFSLLEPACILLLYSMQCAKTTMLPSAGGGRSAIVKLASIRRVRFCASSGEAVQLTVKATSNP